MAAYNAIITSCQKIVAEAREDMEDQKSRAGIYVRPHTHTSLSTLPPTFLPSLTPSLPLLLLPSLTPPSLSHSSLPLLLLPSLTPPSLSHSGTMQTTTLAETRKLVAAYLHGNGLAPLTSQRRSLLIGGRGSRHPPGGGAGKAPSAMKTDARDTAAPYPAAKQRRT